ncbi:MAG: hypothetical protein WB392_04260 [Methanotrichaceae archaeon]
MRWVLALVMLICMMGIVASQTVPSSIGEGYSSAQLQFFNGQNTQDFQPIVEQYWNSYIQNGEKQSPNISNQSNIMSIWLNNFPLGFDKEIQIKSSSFTANAPVATNASSSELESASLTRDVNFNFNQDQSWKYVPGAVTTLSGANGNAVPPKNAQGQIISQGIMSFF